MNSLLIVILHTCETTHVKLDSLTMKSHCTTCVIFFFKCVVIGIPQNLQIPVGCALSASRPERSHQMLALVGKGELGNNGLYS